MRRETIGTGGTVHGVRTYNKPCLYRRTGRSTRYVGASLKAHINDKLKYFRERNSVHDTNSRLCESSGIHDKPHPKPLALSSNDLNLSSNTRVPLAEDERFHRPVGLTRKVAHHIRDWRSESMRCLITRSKPVQQPEPPSLQYGGGMGNSEGVEEANPSAFIQDNQFLRSVHSGHGHVRYDPPMASRQSRRTRRPLREERNSMDIAPGQSYFHTSSDSDNESILQSPRMRILSKIKRSTPGWIRDAFTLDEHEKAFFEFRRNTSTYWTS